MLASLSHNLVPPRPIAVDAGVNLFDSAEMYPVPQRAETQARRSFVHSPFSARLSDMHDMFYRLLRSQARPSTVQSFPA